MGARWRRALSIILHDSVALSTVSVSSTKELHPDVVNWSLRITTSTIPHLGNHELPLIPLISLGYESFAYNLEHFSPVFNL